MKIWVLEIIEKEWSTHYAFRLYKTKKQCLEEKKKWGLDYKFNIYQREIE